MSQKDGRPIKLIRFDPGSFRRFPFIRRVFNLAPSDKGDPNNSPQVSGEEAKTNIEQSYQDYNSVVVEEYDLTAIQSDLDSEFYVQAGMGTVPEWPAVLESVEVTFNKAEGNGVGNYPVSQQYFYINVRGNGSLNPRATAEASVSILPSISWVISDWYRKMVVEHKDVIFWMPTNYTMADVCTKIGTQLGVEVFPFPKFKVVSHQLKIFGQQLSIQQKASTQASLGFNSSEGTLTSQEESFQYGDEYSKNNGLSEKVETIPETIHATITISGHTETADATTEVKANTTSLDINGSPELGAITNEPAPVTVTATGKVTPTSLAATSPASIPTSGVYIVFFNPGNNAIADRIQCHARVVDTTQYA